MGERWNSALLGWETCRGVYSILTMEQMHHGKSRGEAFLQKLRGKCINLIHLFVATRGEIFSLKFIKYRLAAGLCPDPLGELKRAPDP